MSLERFKEHVEKIASTILKTGVSECLLVHHDDADGVVSAALMKLALETRGFRVKTICVEKVLPEIIEKVHSVSKGFVMYVDLGSPHLVKIHEISRRIGRDNLVVVVDHHDFPDECKVTELNHVLHLNPELFEFSGEKDASASIVTYYLARAISSEVSAFSYLPVVGAAEITGNLWLSALGREILRECFNRRTVVVRKYRGREDYFIDFHGYRDSYRSLSAKLTTLAAIGYYQRGPEMAIDVCIHGLHDLALDMVEKLQRLRDTKFKEAQELVEKELKVLRSVQWFHVGNLFNGLGVKVIGLFTSYLRYRRKDLIKEDKYIAGMMYMRREIPGLGELEHDYTKVSFRVTNLLEKLVSEGKAKPLSEVIRLCMEFGGVGDGHAFAASGVILRGREEEFISKVDDALLSR